MKQSTTYIRSFTHSVQKYTSIKNRSSNILVPVNVDESIMYSCIVCCCFHVTIFFGKAEVKLPLGKSRRRLEGDIKWILKKWDGILWTEFMAPFQDKWRWRADANITKKMFVKNGKFFTSSYPNVVYSRNIPLHCVLLERCTSKLSAHRILTFQRGVTGTARMLHALTHSSISRQVREQM